MILYCKLRSDSSFRRCGSSRHADLKCRRVTYTVHSTVPCRQAEVTLARFQAVTVARCFLVHTSHLCLYGIQHYRMISRYAGPLTAPLQYFSFNPCVDPDCYLVPVITPTLKRINHRCVPCGPVYARSDVMQTFFCAIVASDLTFIVFLGHAASFCPLKVRGFTFVSTANRSIFAYDSSIATGTPLLKSVCLCCCRK